MSHKRTLIPLLLLIFLDSFGYFLVIPVLIRLIYNTHAGLLPVAETIAERNIVMGIAIGLGFLAMILAAPLVGSCSDKFGRKKTFLACLVISLLGFVVPILGIVKRSIALVIVGRFIAGVGSASQPVAQAAVTDIAQGKQKALYLSLIAFSMTLALLLGPLAGGYLSNSTLVSWFNTTTPYWIGSVVVVLNIILLWIGFHETAKVSVEHELNLKEIIFGIVPAIKEYQIGILLLSVFLLELGWSQYYNAIIMYLGLAYQYTPEQVGDFTAYLGLLMCFGLLVLYPFLIKRFKLENILIWGIGLVAIGLLCCAIIPGAWAQWVFVIPVTIFTGISYVGLLAVLSNRVAENKQGWIMGYAMTALALAWFITGFVSGWLINIYLDLPFILAAVILILTFLIVKND